MLAYVSNFNSEQKEAFIEGWKKAGGYVGDLDSPYPWCAPWTHTFYIEVDAESDDPATIGAAWWKECAAEVDAAIKGEKLVEA